MNSPAISPRRLEGLLATATRPAADPSAIAALGCTVEVEDLTTGKVSTYRLVEAHEAAPANGLLSIESPVGVAIAGCCTGEVTTASTPRGGRRLRVLAVS